MKEKKIWIIVNVYNEEEGLYDMIERLKYEEENIERKFKINIEFIFIEDGRSEGSLEMLKENDLG